MSFNEFLSAFAPLSVVFKSEISKELIQIYFELFKHYDPNALKMACLQVLQTHKYNTLPKPADLKEILDGTKENEATAKINAIEAFDRAHDARDEHGAYKSVCFEDLKITATINLAFGGWVEFCNSDKGFYWDRKSFIDTYSEIQKTGYKCKNDNYYLKGISEKRNGILAGFDKVKIVGEIANSKGIFELEHKELAQKFALIAPKKPQIGGAKISALIEKVKK